MKTSIMEEKKGGRNWTKMMNVKSMS